MFKEPRILAATIVSAVVLVVGLSLNQTFRKYVYRSREITVTGSAKQVIISDIGKVNFYVDAFSNTEASAYSQNEIQAKQLKEELLRMGVPDSSLKPTQKELRTVYELNLHGMHTQQVRGYNAHRGFALEIRDVRLVERVAAAIPDLVLKGLRVSVSEPEYYYSKLAEVKVNIQSDAAKDARERAKRITEASGSSLGPITSARMGVIQITPRNSVQVEDYGRNDDSTIEKEITAVVSASFVLE